MATPSFLATITPEATRRILLVARILDDNDDFRVRLLYNPNPFRSAFRLLSPVVVIRIHRPFSFATTWNVDDYLHECNINIWDRRDGTLGRILAAFGRHMRSITIINTGRESGRIMGTYSTVYREILRHCVWPDGTIRLQKLGLHLTSESPPAVITQLIEILERCANNLQTLRLAGGYPGVNYVQRFYDTLNTFTNLNRVIFGAYVSWRCLPIWRYVGIRLQTIRLNLPEDTPENHWHALTVRIMAHCPALRRLFLGRHFPRAGINTPYMTLLGFYNTQLTRAPYVNMDLADLPYFMRICPDNRLRWPRGDNTDPAFFRILSPLLEAVTLGDDAVRDAPEPGILTTCGVLVSVEIFNVPRFGARHLFGSMIHSSVREAFLIDSVTTHQAVDLIVNHLPQLKNLNLETTDPFPSPYVFCPLRNVISSLVHVRLIEYTDDIFHPDTPPVPSDRYVRMCIGIVDVLKDAPKLQSVELGTRSVNCDPDIFFNIVQPLRRRGIYCSLEMVLGDRIETPIYIID